MESEQSRFARSLRPERAMAKTLFGGGYELPSFDAATLAAMLNAAPSAGEGRPRSAFPPKRRPRIPVRSESLRRRRMIAAAGLLPPSIAWRFRPSEQAVLGIVGDRIRTYGYCDLFLDQIAALAGVSRSTAKAAIRLAVDLCLLSRQLRPVRGMGKKSRTNVLRMVSLEWQTWLQKRKGRVVPAWSDNRVIPTIKSIDSKASDEGRVSSPETKKGERGYSRTRQWYK